MRLKFFFVFVLLHLVGGEAPCRLNCTQNGLSLTNLTEQGPGNDFDAAALPPPPPPPPRPPLPPSRPPPIQPASDSLWESCKNKGCALSWAMQAEDQVVGPVYNPTRHTARSPYQSTGDLKRWLWAPFPKERINPAIHDFYNTWGIGFAVVDLGINAISYEYEGGKNELFFIDHQGFDPAFPDVDKQWYEVDGRKYRATGASYAFTLNWEDGVIMGLNRKSPKYAAKERDPPVPDEQIPKLNQFSDVAWIGWDTVSRREGTDIRKLRYFLSVGIDNEDTKAIILRAMNYRGWQLSEWPGHVFKREWMETRAILGTPNLQGFAYFLIQHKDRLGNMFIDKLQVFHGDTLHKNPCIVMHLSQPRPATAESEVRDEGKNIIRVHKMRSNL
ncbi:Nn.00g014730.m01.CDS01 [Neocucurbitaria sp. VM-36]